MRRPSATAEPRHVAPRCAAVFDVLRAAACATEPGLSIVTFGVAKPTEFPAARSFAYTLKKSPTVMGIFVAPKLEQADKHRIRGVLAHEFGHAVALLHDVDHTERDADDLARYLFQRRVYYDRATVQTWAEGRYRRRPAFLPK